MDGAIFWLNWALGSHICISRSIQDRYVFSQQYFSLQQHTLGSLTTVSAFNNNNENKPSGIQHSEIEILLS